MTHNFIRLRIQMSSLLSPDALNFPKGKKRQMSIVWVISSIPGLKSAWEWDLCKAPVWVGIKFQHIDLCHDANLWEAH